MVPDRLNVTTLDLGKDPPLTANLTAGPIVGWTGPHARITFPFPQLSNTLFSYCQSFVLIFDNTFVLILDNLNSFVSAIGKYMYL